MKHLREIVERQDLTEYYPFPSGKEVGQLKTPGSAFKAFKTPKKRRSEVDGPLLPSKKQAKSYARAGWENDKKRLKAQAKKGIKWLANKLKEEEQLDELKKETLQNYISKSVSDIASRSERKGKLGYRMMEPQTDKEMADLRKGVRSDERKIWKRKGGISKAAERLSGSMTTKTPKRKYSAKE